ncbi:hypothetical protein ILYODFUR_036570 [Ilyodon furcidens]|uniref:Secreted protein n=1 Tax=Ilyodon furcidens TaxID=33524 RepID=A0ABV0T3J0_9TELE
MIQLLICFPSVCSAPPFLNCYSLLTFFVTIQSSRFVNSASTLTRLFMLYRPIEAKTTFFFTFNKNIGLQVAGGQSCSGRPPPSVRTQGSWSRLITQQEHTACKLLLD